MTISTTPDRTTWKSGSRSAQRLVATVDGTAEAVRPVTWPALRSLLGVVFIWVFDVSPVAKIVSETLPWADPRATVLALGTVELVFGLWLIAGIGLRFVLPLMAAHLAARSWCCRS